MFKVGGVTIPNRLVLAPMEDVTSPPMRLIAKRIGNPGLMFTEFVSAMAIHYGAHKTLRKMRVDASTRPLAIQIFGAEPEIMAETARIAEAQGADIIDINMGCWVPKVCKTGSGAALLKDPDRAAEIVAAVVRAVRVPVTVKVRAGWDYSLFAAPDLARRFQDVGAQMITLHARFARQGYEGQADWELIRAMRDAVKVPLIGNGDVKSAADAVRMREATGCDGVMVGRAAISNPWVLRTIGDALSDPQTWRAHGCPETPAIPLDERIDVALEHLRLTIDYERDTDPQGAELRACRSLRGQMPLYIKGFPGASALRDRITRCSTYNEYQDILREFALGPREPAVAAA